MRPFVILTLIFTLTSGCKSTTSSSADPNERWMDRNIYFAYSDITDVSRNNTFQKERIKDSINYLAQQTMLGEGYFKFSETDESALNIYVEQAAADDTTQKSFILIWPDATFNSFVQSQLSGSIADPNVITVMNNANKRKFFMIFKASCFETNSLCSNIGVNGLNAMIMRQFGLISGLSIKDCLTYPNEIMCASIPSDSQYTDNSQLRFFAALNNVLITILSTPGFYPLLN